MKSTFLAFMLLLVGCGTPAVEEVPLELNDLAIVVTDSSREIGYTNKRSGFLYTESNGPHRTGWQGWHVFARKLLDDVHITVDDSVLRKESAERVTVLPHQFSRSYPTGVVETITLLDSVDALLVSLSGIENRRISASPLVDRSMRPEDYIRLATDGIHRTAYRPLLTNGERSDAPAWIAMTMSGSSILADTSAMRIGRRLSTGTVSTTPREDIVHILLCAGRDESEATTLTKSILPKVESVVAERASRMQRLLDAALFRTNDARFDKAYAWAVISMDALIMDQVRKGIFAGLPWFNNYWGRDSFISLAGAALVTGRFAEAKEILRSFADWQEKTPASPNHGRIPNLVTTSNIGYNTADGTPWFVIALNDYVKASGDTAFGLALYPVVKRSIEGTIRHHLDKDGFLTHEDAETWMDAVGPDGPWSPRGNRACDIQALWFRQLLAGASFARQAGDERAAAEWEALMDRLLASFQRSFIDAKRGFIIDHLNTDGSADQKLRPNQLFALSLVQDPKIRVSAFKAVTEGLVYPHGVGSLAPEDPDFHPFHHYEPYYVQDAAYHQGIVWTWLAGPWIDAAVQLGKPDLAFQVTENMIGQLLDRGAVGTISELLDAAPRTGEQEPRLSGTFSQAWSLAEFIRTAHQSYAGVTVNANERTIYLFPRLPERLHDAHLAVPMGRERVFITLSAGSGSGTIRLTMKEARAPITFVLGWPVTHRTGRRCSFTLFPEHDVSVRILEEDYEVTGHQGDPVEIESFRQDVPLFDELNELRLATPRIPSATRSVLGPSHELLTHAQIKSPQRGARIVLDAVDLERDDHGPGYFAYPLNASFHPGILDLTRFSVAENDSNIFFQLTFRSLSDPGWHPEYGFQLTYAAIAIDTDGIPGRGRTDVGKNSRFTLPKERAAEFCVFVGGGVRLEGAKGEIVAEYLPSSGDDRDPLGSTAAQVISFALPNRLLRGNPADWRFTVLVGAQDDHGGAGVGDFRSVETVAGEWVGGGRRTSTESNIYDTLVH